MLLFLGALGLLSPDLYPFQHHDVLLLLLLLLYLFIIVIITLANNDINMLNMCLALWSTDTFHPSIQLEPHLESEVGG